MKKRKLPEMAAEEEAAAAERLRRIAAVNEMLKLAGKFPGLREACLTPRWVDELERYVAEPLARGAW